MARVGFPLSPTGRRPATRTDDLLGRLVLEDGTVFEGRGFGASTTVAGEVVFTTGMVGYPESLTDPSYRGQILSFTFPLLGNYGVPAPNARDVWGLPSGFESPAIQARAMICRSLTPPHHWASSLSLPEWLARAKVPGVAEVDTRRLTEHLRAQGVMRGLVAVGRTLPSPEAHRRQLARAPRYEDEDHVAAVAPKAPVWVKSGGRALGRVAVLDCGCKASILRALLRRRLDVLRWTPGERVPERFDGKTIDAVLVANGPGDPANLVPVVETVREVLDGARPVLGICLGHQLVALARGGTTYKLKFGHRGQNKPVVFPDGRSYILSENHGYAVDEASLRTTGLEPWARNPDDGTLEGFRDARGRIIALQGHPEGGPGPREAGFVFDLLAEKVRRSA